ncbi:hypothetical protein [Spirosoma sp.]|uniref:hypothetical protein n=1 Tax=Spirosoma sp. TaxID=1899569 RepID=UPI003B3A88AD
MLTKAATTIGRIYSFIVSLIAACVLIVLTWAAWGFYRDVALEKTFAEEGKLTTVTVNDLNSQQRSWRDYLGNVTYLTFTYQGKSYTSRYVVDSVYVDTGDPVQLLYHADYDAFRQPQHEPIFRNNPNVSRLINWSSVTTLSDETKLLLICLVLSVLSFFVVSGVIMTFVPIPFLSATARILLIGICLVLSVFFSYDTYQYFQYYQQIKADGQPVTVRVLDTSLKEQTQHLHRRRHSRIDLFGPSYRYQATVQDQQKQRIIAIDKTDYETIRPGATLQTLYAPSLNDMMSVRYTPSYTNLIVLAFFWVVTFVLIGKGFYSSPKKPQSVS